MKLPGWIVLTLGFAAVAPLQAQYVGQLTGNVGVGSGVGQGSGGTSIGLNVSLAFWTRILSLGPEGLYQGLGNGRSALAVGGVLRVPVGGHRVRPYLVMSLGYYSWRTPLLGNLDLFAGSAGLGAEVGSPTRKAVLVAETRFHSSLQNSGGGDTRRFLTLTGGVRLRW